MTEEGFAELSRGIRDMAKVMPQSATEIARVAEAAGQLGVENDAILDFTKTMVNMGVATDMSSDGAAMSLARLATITQMNQKDFDKLGSTVVGLGNNLAATEGEIVGMGLRLAGAGKVIGMSEAQILGFSGALAAVGVNAEAGGSAFSKLFIEAANLAATGGKGLTAFAKVAGMSSKEFQKSFKDDATGAIISFIEGLGKINEAGGNVFGVLDDLGLSEIRLRDALLRTSGASDVLRKAVDLGTKSWKDNNALTKEAEERYKTSESQLKIMWNRVKDVAITLGNALVPAVMSAIDAAGPLIKQIESGAKAFSEMDEEQQRSILKMIALVAAVGPASIALGGMTTAIGGVLKVGGGLATSLGKAGGVGLLGRIGLLGPAAVTPVGAAVLGVGALALGIYAVNKASQESIQDSLKVIQSKKDELIANEELVGSFEELQKQNKLTTKEVLRYMDIMTELKDAETDEAIKSLTKEQADLLEKSGYTNDEMVEFLRLNGEIVKNAPATAKAISEQGNAYVDVLDKVKELNKAERDRLTDDTWLSLTAELDKQKSELQKQEKLQKDIGKLEGDRKNTIDEINKTSSKIREQQEFIRDIENDIKNATVEEIGLLETKLQKANLDLILLVDSRKEHEKTEKSLDKQIGKKEKSLEKTMKELRAFDELKDEYEQMVLFQAGITAEKGKGVEKLKEEQKNIDEARRKLEKLKDKGEEFTGEYEAQNKKLSEQQSKLDTAKKKLEDMNKEAGRTIYKDVKVSTNPSISRFNDLLRQTVTKKVNLDVGGGGGVARFSAYADGTPLGGHRGGPFLAGEEGFELGRLGNRWEMLNLGMYDRPSGYEVFTHDESKSILRALNRMPAYADGISRTGEADRVVNQLNNQQPMNDSSGQVVSLLRDIAKGIREGKIIQIDGETVTNIVNTNNAIGSAINYF